MKKFLILILPLIIIMSSCTSKKEREENNTNKAPEMLGVSIETPKTINLNEEIPIEALVKQGDKKIDDANEVKFEIWKSGQDEHELYDGKLQSNGIYSVNHTFEEAGTYFIVAHVTAKNMHSMPKKEITVRAPETDSNVSKSDGSSNNGDTHHHVHSGVSIELILNSDEMQINTVNTLSVTIENEGQPVTEANVRFEVWKENNDKHEYIDSTEKSPGTYETQYTFLAKGTYQVKIHVLKGHEIHDHVQETIYIK